MAELKTQGHCWSVTQPLDLQILKCDCVGEAQGIFKEYHGPIAMPR